MAKVIPRWQWLEGEAGPLEFSVAGAGILQVFRKGEKKSP